MEKTYSEAINLTIEEVCEYCSKIGTDACKECQAPNRFPSIVEIMGEEE